MAVATLFDYQNRQDSRVPPIVGIKDSKKFANVAQREEVYKRLLKCPELWDFGIGEVSVDEINHRGIQWANETAFARALEQLTGCPFFTIVDGTVGTGSYWNGVQGRELVIPKADDIYWQVGAASIIAKVIRDRYMREQAMKYPQYDFENSAGYGTPKHLAALRQYGPCPLHRRQFVQKILKGG